MQNIGDGVLGLARIGAALATYALFIILFFSGSPGTFFSISFFVIALLGAICTLVPLKKVGIRSYLILYAFFVVFYILILWRL
jgi:hypothetical protein